MSNGIDLITLALARKGGGVTPEELTEALALKQNKLTAGTNVDITNNVISSNQPTAPNPYKLTYTSGNGTEAYDGSLPKMITLEKLNGATKDFVNSSIATNTAFFKGTFTSVSALPSTGVTNNDYAFIVVYEELVEPPTVKQYDRYKYSTEIDDETGEVVGWVYEYTLNNSSFTAEEWATIQSGITEDDVTQIETNRSDIADIRVNMPDSPEDVKAQPVALTIEAEADEDLSIIITDSRYVTAGVVNYQQLFTDAITSFNAGVDVVLRVAIGDGSIILDLKCNCFNGNDLVFEGHNMAAVIVVAMASSSVEVAAMYDIEPAESLESAEDGDLTTAKAQKDYFQTKITSSNKIPYSNISGTPTIPAEQVNADWNATSGKAQILNKPTIPAAQQQTNWNSTSGITSIANKPSNFVLGYSGTTSTASALKIVTCTQAQYDSSSKDSDTIYLIKS